MKKDKKENLENIKKSSEQAVVPAQVEHTESVVEPQQTPPPTLGAMIRQKREELGIDISLVEGVLKIPTHNLKKIENDNLDALPSQLFAKGYIKSYASFLGIPEEAILEAYDRQMGDKLLKTAKGAVNNNSNTTQNKKIHIPIDIKSEEPKKNAVLYIFIALGLFFTTVAVILITMKDRISSSQYANIKDEDKVDFDVATTTEPEPILENSPTKIADLYEVFSNALSVNLQINNVAPSWISMKDAENHIIFEDNLVEESEKLFEIPKNKFPITLVIGRGDEISIKINDIDYTLPKPRLVSNTIRIQLTLDMVSEFLKQNAKKSN